MLPITVTTGAAAVVWTTLLVRWLGLYGCCLALPVIANCFGYDFYHASVLTADRVMIAGLCGLYAVQRALQVRPGKPLDRADLILGAFLGILTASTLLHDWRWRDAQPLANLLFLYAVPAALYWLTRESLQGEKAIRLLFTVLALFGLYLGLTAIAEVKQIYAVIFPRFIINSPQTEWLGRARGPFLNPTTNGAYLCAAMLAWAMIWPRARGLQRFFVVAGILICLVGVYGTLTRSCWLGAVLCMIVVGLSAMPRHIRIPAMLLGCLALGMLLAVGKDSLKSFKRDKDVSEYYMEQSAKLRPILATVAWGIFKDHPVWGVGYGQYKRVDRDYLRAIDTELPLEQARGYVQHNLFLAILVDLGLVGLGAYVLVLAAWTWRGWKLWRNTSLPLPYRQLGLLMVAFIGQWSFNGLFHDVSLPTNSNLLLLMLGGALQGAWLDSARAEFRKPESGGRSPETGVWKPNAPTMS